jgi:hypothetical protein
LCGARCGSSRVTTIPTSYVLFPLTLSTSPVRWYVRTFFSHP